jgi:hypothetical protein
MNFLFRKIWIPKFIYCFTPALSMITGLLLVGGGQVVSGAVGFLLFAYGTRNFLWRLP